MSGEHPRFRLDETIHAPVRLSIMAALAAADRVDFAFLRESLEVSDSLLSKHMARLEAAGYVKVAKGYVGKRPRTWFSLTSAGRAAFQNYADALRQVMVTTASDPSEHNPQAATPVDERARTAPCQVDQP